MKKILFNVRHWYRDVMMAKIGKVRLWFPEGMKAEVWLGEKYKSLLNAQLADRRSQNIQEIECRVFWGE